MDLCSGSAGIGLAFHEVVPRFIAVFISEPTWQRGRAHPASDHIMRQSESLPVVVCPGCKLPMALKERRRLGASKLTTAVFRCAQCGMETERNFKNSAR